MKKMLSALALASVTATGVAATPAMAQGRHYERGYDRQYDQGYYGDRGYGEGYYRPRGYAPRSYYRRDQGVCQRRSGTTGTIIGGALGALLGRQVTRGGNYGRNSGTTGAIVGAAGGALAGRAIERGNCR